MGIFDKLNQFTESVANSVSGNQFKNSNSVSNSQVVQTQPNQSFSDESKKSIHDEFSPMVGVGGKKFAFRENSFLYGSEEFDYSQLSEINLVHIPTTTLMNGVAQTNLNGKVINLAFQFNQKERFVQALNFANEKIALAHGMQKDYKFLLQSTNGSKIEVYDDYLQMYYIPVGAKNIISNSFRGGTIKSIMHFDKLAITINGMIVMINYNGEEYQLPINDNDMALVQEIISHISEIKSKDVKPMMLPVSAQESWNVVVGEKKTFSLNGMFLEFEENQDVFNSYRLRFRKLASECTECARNEFDKKIKDLTSYLDFFPEIYGYYCRVVCDKVMQILIADGIWTVNKEQFLERHCNKFHSAMDEFLVTVESVELTIKNNQASVAKVMDFIPQFSGGGFGLKGALIGVAKAEAFNFATGAVASSLIQGSASINPAQQKELYDRINPDMLFEHVFLDYWKTFLTLTDVLNENGKNVWFPTDVNINQAYNIFQNFSVPGFPQDKILEAMISILRTNPYNAEYHKFMINRFGETDEIKSIVNYFGYTDFNNPRMI